MLFSPPLIEEKKSPLAVFFCPPLTEVDPPLISLKKPTTNRPKMEVI